MPDLKEFHHKYVIYNLENNNGDNKLQGLDLLDLIQIKSVGML